jgi:hypothetical protein
MSRGRAYKGSDKQTKNKQTNKQTDKQTNFGYYNLDG